MKKISILLFSVVLILSFFGIANAIPTTWTDPYSANVLMDRSNSFYSYDHDITSVGFNPGVDSVLTWDITLYFTDDSRRDLSEWAFVNLPGLIADRTFEVDFNDSIYTGFSVAGTISLNIDGLLSVDIYRTSGDFYFKGSTLNAYGDSAPVPEPATMLLLGTGLFGLAVGSRKKIFKKK